MKKLVSHQGKVIPLNRVNIDTDAIIPKQFLKSIHRSGFGDNLFDEWRYLDQGEPGMDCSQRPVNPDFIFNNPVYRDGSILLTGDNFGCGSSREHACWALSDFGIRVVIASSFAEIFANNAIKNGLLPLVLKAEEIESLFNEIENNPGIELKVDVENQCVQKSDGVVYYFELSSFIKYRLMNGLDEIALTLQSAEKIKTYEQNRRQAHPWIFGA